MNAVHGDSMRDQAIRIAGALAELSITELAWQAGTAATATLQTRATDLPALLTTAPPGSRLFAASLNLTVEVQSDDLKWASTSPIHAAAFAAALGNS